MNPFRAQSNTTYEGGTIIPTRYQVGFKLGDNFQSDPVEAVWTQTRYGWKLEAGMYTSADFAMAYTGMGEHRLVPSVEYGPQWEQEEECFWLEIPTEGHARTLYWKPREGHPANHVLCFGNASVGRNGYGIDLQGTHGVRLYGMKILGASVAPLFIGNCYDIEMDNCEFAYSRFGVHGMKGYYSDNIRQKDMHVHDVGNGCVYIVNGGNNGLHDNWTIDGGLYENALAPVFQGGRVPDGHGIGIEGGRGHRVRGATFRGWEMSGLTLDLYPPPVEMSDIIVEDCKFIRGRPYTIGDDLVSRNASAGACMRQIGTSKTFDANRNKRVVLRNNYCEGGTSGLWVKSEHPDSGFSLMAHHNTYEQCARGIMLGVGGEREAGFRIYQETVMNCPVNVRTYIASPRRDEPEPYTYLDHNTYGSGEFVYNKTGEREVVDFADHQLRYGWDQNSVVA